MSAVPCGPACTRPSAPTLATAASELDQITPADRFATAGEFGAALA